MAIILAFNPGSNSLKFELVEAQRNQHHAGEGKRLLTGTFDDIGKEGLVELVRNEEKVVSRKATFKDMGAATQGAFDLLQNESGDASGLARSMESQIDLIAIRVVHGGDVYDRAVTLDKSVRREIKAREILAPLHNANSLRIADAVSKAAPGIPVAVAFDTAFHRTIPEVAWRYPIPRELADHHGIRKYGFHGLSHRYMLEQYAWLANKSPESVTAVTLHLESGSSAAAILQGKSVDTSMGFTPLDGLMMGTRSGSIDPAILPWLIDQAGMSTQQVSEILDKKSGLLGISGISLDTRILSKRTDPHSLQAIEMFGYRVRLFLGAYLSLLGDPEAVIFGGGIGENTQSVRTQACAGLARWGLSLDPELNQSTSSGDHCISTSSSRTAAWVLHSEENLQLAHECLATL